MQKTILILLSILLFSSCKHDENSIEFTKFANLDLGNLSKESATLRADAIFMNHSQSAFNLKDITIDFSIDGKDVGTIVVKKDKVIQPNSEFTIPIKYEYATNSFLEPNHEPSGTYAVQLLGDINFTNENLPAATSSYKIVESVIDDKDASHVSVGFSDMRTAQPMTWGSDSKSGSLDFAVNGNEIKCSFSNLTLQPNSFFNKGELNNPATVSGELTIYKN